EVQPHQFIHCPGLDTQPDRVLLWALSPGPNRPGTARLVGGNTPGSVSKRPRLVASRASGAACSPNGYSPWNQAEKAGKWGLVQTWVSGCHGCVSQPFGDDQVSTLPLYRSGFRRRCVETCLRGALALVFWGPFLGRDGYLW